MQDHAFCGIGNKLNIQHNFLQNSIPHFETVHI